MSVSQFSSVAQSCPTLCGPMNCSTPGLPVHHQLREFTQTHIHRVGDAIQPSHSLSSPSPAPNPSSIRVFSNKSTLHLRWPKYWSFSFSIFPSKEHPGLISFRMDWLDLPAVQGTLKSLLQHQLDCVIFMAVLFYPINFTTTNIKNQIFFKTFVLLLFYFINFSKDIYSHCKLYGMSYRE